MTKEKEHTPQDIGEQLRVALESMIPMAGRLAAATGHKYGDESDRFALAQIRSKAVCTTVTDAVEHPEVTPDSKAYPDYMAAQVRYGLDCLWYMLKTFQGDPNDGSEPDEGHVEPQVS